MLSVIIPIYNAEPYLKVCIDSVLSQSYEDIELILVDDGSTDRSLEICQSYENQDKRVKIITAGHNGPYNARRMGVLNSNGEYVTFVDADDFINKNSYIFASCDMNSDVDIISFDIIRYYDEYNKKIDVSSLEEKTYYREELAENIFPIMIWDEKKDSFGIDPAFWNKIYKSNLIKKLYINDYGIKFHYGEDVAVVYSLISDAKSLSIHHRAYYNHRQRLSSTIPAYISDEQYLDKLYDLYKHMTMIFPHPMFKRQIDLFYAHSIQYIKKKYGIPSFPQDMIFPFDKVKKNEKIILYGAGNGGNLFLKQLKMLDYCSVVLWVDKNYMNLGSEISSPEKIKSVEFDKVVIAIANENIKQSVREFLIKAGISNEKII